MLITLTATMPALATESWLALTGAEINAALEGHVLRFDGATQGFRASGKTLYTTNGQDSWGNWRVEGDRYCSQWPPSDLWACYSVAWQGDAVRFVGEAGDISEGVYAD